MLSHILLIYYNCFNFFIFKIIYFEKIRFEVLFIYFFYCQYKKYVLANLVKSWLMCQKALFRIHPSFHAFHFKFNNKNIIIIITILKIIIKLLKTCQGLPWQSCRWVSTVCQSSYGSGGHLPIPCPGVHVCSIY